MTRRNPLPRFCLCAPPVLLALLLGGAGLPRQSPQGEGVGVSPVGVLGSGEEGAVVLSPSSSAVPAGHGLAPSLPRLSRAWSREAESRGGVDGTQPTGHDVLIYGAGLTPRGLNPMLDRNEWNEVSSAILSRLFRPDHTGQIVGDLVESYTVSDDGLTYRLRLRDNLRWHDATPCTADDVLFTWQKLFDPATPTSLDLNQPMLRSFEKAGTHGFIFRLRYPDPGFLAPLTEVPILPAHILRNTHINPAPPAGDPDAFDRNPIGTGPYKLVTPSTAHLGRGAPHPLAIPEVSETSNLSEGEADKNPGPDHSGEFVLERHNAYHFGPPPIPKLILRVIPDDDARAEAVARGEVHLTQVKPQHVARLRDLPHLRLYRMRTGAWRGMPLNLRRPALQDKRVRRAIDLAIDRDAIVAAALAGFGQPAYSPIPPASWAFDPEMNRRRYDPAEAERLLDAAGWKKNPDGRRERAGRPLELNLIVWKDEIFRRTAAELIASNLEPLGIRVILHRVDNATYNRLAQNMATTYDTFIGGWGGLLDPGDNLAKKFHSRGSQNYTGYHNPTVDRLLARARSFGTSPRQRARARRLYLRLLDLLTDDAVFLPLAYPDYVFAADTRLAGLGESAPNGVEGFVCDSWYEFTKFAHEWSWQPR